MVRRAARIPGKKAAASIRRGPVARSSRSGGPRRGERISDESLAFQTGLPELESNSTIMLNTCKNDERGKGRVAQASGAAQLRHGCASESRIQFSAAVLTISAGAGNLRA